MRYYILLFAAFMGTAKVANAQEELPTNLMEIFKPTTVKEYFADTTLSPVNSGTPTQDPNSVHIECNTGDGQKRYCVNPKFCDKNNNIITTGKNLFAKRRDQDIACPSGQICCVLSSQNSHTSAAITTSTIATVVSEAEKKGCGWRNKYGYTNRIFGENQALFGEFPWALPIFKIEDNVEVYLCGGSLIHPQLVLTFASKFTRKGQFVVKPGEYDLLGDYEIRGHQTIEVAKRIVHEHFNSGGMFNDIALLVLKEAVSVVDHVGFACLPTIDTRPKVGTECFVTGWGADKAVNGTMQNIPKMIQVPFVQRDVCQATLQREIRPQFALHSTVMCMGGVKDEDVCNGDGGSPLVCQYPGQKGRYYQAGIVSWGLRCGREGVPSMYTDVAALRPWLDRVIQAEGFDTTYSTP